MDGTHVLELLTFFGGLALLIACLGVYGILKCLVSSRTFELGLRKAPGGSNQTVRMFTDCFVPVTVGMGVGLMGAIMLTSWVKSLLFGDSPHDGWTISVAVGV
jgi:ABC-type antimicrobial peptide transport system permease subunit